MILCIVCNKLRGGGGGGAAGGKREAGSG